MEVSRLPLGVADSVFFTTNLVFQVSVAGSGILLHSHSFHWRVPKIVSYLDQILNVQLGTCQIEEKENLKMLLYPTGAIHFPHLSVVSAHLSTPSVLSFLVCTLYLRYRNSIFLLALHPLLLPAKFSSVAQISPYNIHPQPAPLTLFPHTAQQAKGSNSSTFPLFLRVHNLSHIASKHDRFL